MKANVRPWLQLLMWSVCAFHVAVGLGLNLVPGFTDTMAAAYGAHVEQLSPQLLYILKPLGAFMLALGIAAAFAALKPREYRGIIYAFVTLFIIRALHRIVFGQEISEVFGISSGRNLANAVFFFGLAAALVIADVLSQRSLPTNRPNVA